MINWINSWKSGNKKNKYSITIRLGRISAELRPELCRYRLGRLTVFEFKLCPCDSEGCTKFRFMVLNLGFEL